MTIHHTIFCALAGLTLFFGGCDSTPRDQSSAERRLSIHSADVTEHDGWMATNHRIGGSRLWIAPDIAGQTIHCDSIVDAKVARDSDGRHVVVVTLDALGADMLEVLCERQSTRVIAVMYGSETFTAPLIFGKLDRELVLARSDWSRQDAEDLAADLLYMPLPSCPESHI